MTKLTPKPKRQIGRITHIDALVIVMSYHSNNATQGELAIKYGVSRATINNVCHGKAHPLAWFEVFGREAAQ
jgi:hypothetical protein